MRINKALSHIAAFILCMVLITASSGFTCGEKELPEETVASEPPAEAPVTMVARAHAEKVIPQVFLELPEPEPESVQETPVPAPEAMPEPAPEPEAEIDPVRLEHLACLIYSEAGGDDCSDECRIDVGDVALNRENDPRFPDTLEEVLTAPRQYGNWHTTGIVWPARASNPLEAAAVERAYDIARRLLSGEHGELFGAGYVWEAEFEQGTDGFWLDGLYFGR